MKPPIVAPVTRPSAQKMSRITAIVYNIKNWLVCRLARFRASRQLVNGLVGRYRRGDGHVVDHAGHAVDVAGKFSDEAYFSSVGSNAAHCDDAIRR